MLMWKRTYLIFYCFGLFTVSVRSCQKLFQWPENSDISDLVSRSCGGSTLDSPLCLRIHSQIQYRYRRRVTQNDLTQHITTQNGCIKQVYYDSLAIYFKYGSGKVTVNLVLLNNLITWNLKTRAEQNDLPHHILTKQQFPIVFICFTWGPFMRNRTCLLFAKNKLYLFSVYTDRLIHVQGLIILWKES